jgi:predicted alpha-1,2-mannosidase
LAGHPLGQGQDPVVFVNPFVGTGGHGHTFPGATLPFGMVQLSPDTRIDGSWDGCSGYHHSDSLIYGFSHTHLSGTGVSDYGDMHFLPLTQKPADHAGPIGIAFRHEKESAEAGYYQVNMENGIRVELTSTLRTGMQRIQFPDRAREQLLLLDLNHRDPVVEGIIETEGNRHLRIARLSKAWAQLQHCYARVAFSAPFIVDASSTPNRMLLRFQLKPNEPLIIQTGISLTDTAGARRNLEAEWADFQFDKTRRLAYKAWNDELSKIIIENFSDSQIRVFYTALYHVMIHPNTASDVDGRYRGHDNQIHHSESTQYTVFSLWDTFRAAHPLYALIDRRRTTDFIRSFLNIYRQGGRLPVWELASNETDCMIGYHSVSVIADAMARGIGGFDSALALEAMCHSARLSHLGLEAYQSRRQITADDEHESVSKQLEYAYDDWCIAQVATKLGDSAVAREFGQRAQYWKNLFDPQTGFMRPKKNGGWIAPFDPREVNNHFTEGNSWQYSFFVPHDMPGLVEAHGGTKAFEAQLDRLFTTDSRTTGREQADITGLIGQYAHGNEPSHHMAFLYHITGRSDKSQQRIHQILSDFYRNTPDGLIGNEDCGQMSAWYVLASLGLYPVAPGAPEWLVAAPIHKQARIFLENGRIIELRTKGEGIYPASLHRNGVKQERLPIILHEELGGLQLHFRLDTSASQCLPPAAWPIYPVESPIMVNPIIETPASVFDSTMLVRMYHPDFRSITHKGLPQTESTVKLYYTTDGSDPIPGQSSEIKQSLPITLRETTHLKALATDASMKVLSGVVEARIHKRPNRWQVRNIHEPNRMYTAGGAAALVDGLRGSVNWRKGDWQGIQGHDFVSVVDLGQKTNLSTVSAGFLQDTRSWILLPSEVRFLGSNNGSSFRLLGQFTHQEADNRMDVFIKELGGQLARSGRYRYIKVEARQYGNLPSWHPGAGYPTFIFVDELQVNTPIKPEN